MGAIALDTSVLIGLLNAGDDLHERSSTALTTHHEAGDRFILPAIVLAEALAEVVRVQPARVATVMTQLSTLFGPTHVVDDDVAAEAARLHAKHRSLRLPDALVLATAVMNEADVILTADKRWARIDRRVKVL